MKKRKNNHLILRFFGKTLLFLIKTPYYMGKGGYFLFKKSKEKVKERKIMKKRESMTADYEEFKIIKTEKGDYEKFKDKIYKSESKIGIILGARGTGKTAIGLKMLENVYAKEKRKCFAIGFSENEMPSWIKVVQNISELENNSFVLIDEGGVLFSSRKAMSSANKMLSELILIARHKNLSILFISQNCLPSNQKILTPKGIKKLEELKVKDLVYAYDFNKNRIVPAIAKKSPKINKKIVKIHLEDGRILKSSEDHKWIVYDKNGMSEKKAKDLNNLEDYLIDVSGNRKEL